ncbi:hypothetical protein QBC44DRAFT_325156, partial [Cladorrhinum sp. PSN332]
MVVKLHGVNWCGSLYFLGFLLLFLLCFAYFYPPTRVIWTRASIFFFFFFPWLRVIFTFALIVFC